MKKHQYSICISSFLCLILFFAFKPSMSRNNEIKSKAESFIPKEGFVPNKDTAMRIAEAVWLPIYGKNIIEKEKPFQATLIKGNWLVEGSMPKISVSSRRLVSTPPGGVAMALISKKDGRIIKINHGE